MTSRCGSTRGMHYLDRSMNTNHTVECEDLCKKKGVSGCCYLDDAGGCQFKNDYFATIDKYESGIAVNCIASSNCFPSHL